MLLKSRIASLVHNSFKKKDGSTRYTHIKIGGRKGYFVNSINGGGENMYTTNQRCKMVDFLVDNIFVKMSFSSSDWNPYGNELCTIAG